VGDWTAAPPAKPSRGGGVSEQDGAHRLGGEAPAGELPAHGHGGLVLLCHKFWCPFRVAQHGQRESVVARAATNLRRIVAIEFGMWRSGRNGGSSGLVTFA
jgi:hypothetical protein